jgi:hypothetical protein
LPAGIVERSEDGRTVRRVLESPLVVHAVVVRGPRGRELRAVQDASLFAGFLPRWVATERDTIAAAAVLEAQVFGVGLLDPDGCIVLPAEPPRDLIFDGRAWLLREQTYRRWLRGQPPASGTPA